MSHEMLEKLTLIANEVTKISTADIPPYWISPVAIIISAIVGFTASHVIFIRKIKRENKQIKNKQSQIHYLLKNEIEMRWIEMIYPCLEHISLEKNGLNKLKKINLIGLYEFDLFIINKISNSILENNYFDDPEYISKIIHANVLYIDLIWFQKKINRFLKEIENEDEKFNFEQIKMKCVEYNYLLNKLNKRITSIIDNE